MKRILLNNLSSPILVSIGLPVYNEERYIDATLTSLRNQDYPNIEIVVSDNASTDATLSICERHAAEDRRIRIERTATNRGVTANFVHVMEQARGGYFMWAGGHDLWSRNLVSECVALLEADPGACLAFGSSRWIDRDGGAFPKQSGWTDTRGLAPVARFFTILWGNMHPVMGLMRIDQLRACRRLPNMVGGDLVLLSELSLRGHFVHAARAEWCRREIRDEAHHDDKIRRYASAETRLSQSRIARLFPLLRLPLALLRTIAASRLPFALKLVVMVTLIPSFVARYLVGRQR